MEDRQKASESNDAGLKHKKANTLEQDSFEEGGERSQDCLSYDDNKMHSRQAIIDGYDDSGCELENDGSEEAENKK